MTGAAVPDRFRTAAALVLVAFNLRLVFSSLSAVLPEIMADTGASPAEASWLTVGPVLCLGLFAPFAPLLSRRIGPERLVLVLLILLAVGTASRGVAHYGVILAGTLAAGAAIAALNVLLPALVKRDFPDRIAPTMGLYTMALCAGAALAAGLTVPLMHRLGDSWSGALAAWSLPAVAAALAWGSRHRGLPPTAAPPDVVAIRPWRDSLAWQVTALMASQSALAYSVFGWLSPILRERGLDAATAGFVLSASVAAQLVGSLVAPWAATRGRDQRAATALLTIVSAAGLLGCLYGPLTLVWPLAVFQGLGQGGLLAVTMTIIVLRSPDAPTAAALSGMAQGIGYVVAAGAPFAVGLIRSEFGSFAPTGWLFAAITVAALAAGFGAGRRRLIRS